MLNHSSSREKRFLIIMLSRKREDTNYYFFFKNKHYGLSLDTITDNISEKLQKTKRY